MMRKTKKRKKKRRRKEMRKRKSRKATTSRIRLQMHQGLIQLKIRLI
jgi:hypothetical protein